MRSCPDRGEAVIQPQQSSVRNRLLGALSPEDFALLPLQFVHLPLNHVLVEPKVRIEYMYFIEEGMTSIVTDTLIGKVEIGWSVGKVWLLPLPSCSARIIARTSISCRCPEKDCRSQLGISLTLRIEALPCER